MAAAAPKLYGTVESVGADGVNVSGALGQFVVTVDSKGSVWRLAAGGAEQVHGGDHVAFAAGSGQSPAALLVLSQ